MQKALAELYGLYWQPLHEFARLRGRSPEAAQDLMQRVSLRDRPVFFVELNKYGRLVTVPKFDNDDVNIRKNKRQWR